MVIFPSMVFWWFVICVVNISCPPSISLLGEIMVFCGVLGWSWISFFGLMCLSFICAIYRLYLYSFISHGEGVGNFTVGLFESREFMLMVCHLIPSFIVLFRGDLLFF